MGKYAHIFEVRRQMDEEAEPAEVDATPVVDQSTTPVSQSPAVVDKDTGSDALVDQSTGIPVPQSPSPPVSTPAEVEAAYPSRVNKRKKGIWLPGNKLDHYENWQHERRKQYPNFQDAVEHAMDMLTGIPVDQSPSPPVDQSTTLITNELTNLVINDEKAKRALARYAQVSRRRPTQKDVDAYAEVAHLPIEAIEQGVDETGRRAAASGKQYNGFRYGLNVIREVSKNYQPPTPVAEPERCDLCRELNGFVNVYQDGQRVGVKKCPNHGAGK